ncbi:MAG: T9SS type A sorting domain-containing protein [Flavobacteriaceae bacterium]|jgi:endonuclease/exonuclease/phosphatase family metal-dependent hydrolase|nr:T9SS type A sorting domain-containing protein [Flavobacteriaceae bacterium]
MRKLNNILLSIFLTLTLTTTHTQTVIFDETLTTYNSFNTFTVINVSGEQSWYCNTQYGYTLMNGFSNGQSHENEDWLLSPEINIENFDNLRFSFNHTRGPASAMNVGVAHGWYKVFATTNFTGDISTTQWIELSGINHNISGGWQWVSSGELIIPETAKSTNTRFAFRYLSNNTESATWQIKDVKITGETSVVNPNDEAVFKITTWNIEHFGSICDGPTDENLQLANVAHIIQTMNSDIICLQEVTQSVEYPTISTLVSVLGSNEWGGYIVASNATNCSQNQGIIYKKSKVQFVNAALLSNGNPSQGNSYYYNWSSGRFPALYNVNLIVGTELIPVSFVNIHAKSSYDENSYIRRKGASEGLKEILDSGQYNTNKIVVIGDFNDYINNNTCYVCDTNESPYKNFLDDAANYMIPTQNLESYGCSYFPNVINNMIISNEIFDNYVSNSANQELAVLSAVSNYCETTSNHTPVSILFDFSETLDVKDYYSGNPLKIYPNPVNNILNFDILASLNNEFAEIFDITGKKILVEKLNGSSINVSSLSNGIYILKIGNQRNKFIKN